MPMMMMMMMMMTLGTRKTYWRHPIELETNRVMTTLQFCCAEGGGDGGFSRKSELGKWGGMKRK
jgi:hypothetical protein